MHFSMKKVIENVLIFLIYVRIITSGNSYYGTQIRKDWYSKMGVVYQSSRQAPCFNLRDWRRAFGLKAKKDWTSASKYRIIM